MPAPPLQTLIAIAELPITFGAPLMVWGALACAMPVIIHLVLRQRARRQVLPTLRFLMKSHSSATRAHRIKHLLLLACRMCIILLIVGLLMRTTYSPRAQQAATLWLDAAAPPVSAVFAVDDSASMGYRFQSRTRLRAAIDWARSLLQDSRRFPASSQIAIVAGSSRPGEAFWTQDLHAADRMLDRTRLCDHDHSVNELLEASYALLGTARHPRREIYIFNDLTEHSWRGSLPPAPKDLTGIFILDVGQSENNNVALGWPAIPKSTLAAGRSTPMSIRVRTGDLDAEPLLELSVDGKPRARQSIGKMTANSEVEAMLELPAVERGTHDVRIDLQPEDALACDNHRFAAVSVGDLPKVLIVSNESNKEVATLLASMIAPPAQQTGEHRFDLQQLPASQLADANLDGMLAVILADVEQLSAPAWQKLKTHVEAGGTLAIVPGSNVSPKKYSEHDDLLPTSIESIADIADAMTLAAHDLTHPYLKPFEDESIDSINARQVYRRLNLTSVAAGGQVIAPFSDGKPALLERPVGKGRTILFAFSPARDWGQFGSQAAPMIVLVHTLLGTLAPPAKGIESYTAGQATVHPLAPTDGPIVYGKNTTDDAKPLQVENGGVHLSTAEAGSYRVSNDSQSTSAWLQYSVNIAEAESSAVRKTPKSLIAVLPAGKVLVATDAQDLLHFQRYSGGNRQILVPLALALFGLLFVESLFANRFYGFRRKPVTE